MESIARSLNTGLGIAGSSWDALRAALGQVTRATTIEVSQAGPLSCLRVVGALDKRIAKELKAQAKAFSKSDGTAWAIDLSGVTAWDSEGLASLVYALDVSGLVGKHLSLLSPSNGLRQTLEKAQLHRLFIIVTAD